VFLFFILSPPTVSASFFSLSPSPFLYLRLSPPFSETYYLYFDTHAFVVTSGAPSIMSPPLNLLSPSLKRYPAPLPCLTPTFEIPTAPRRITPIISTWARSSVLFFFILSGDVTPFFWSTSRVCMEATPSSMANGHFLKTCIFF